MHYHITITFIIPKHSLLSCVCCVLTVLLCQVQF